MIMGTVLFYFTEKGRLIRLPTWVQWFSFILSIIGSFSGIYALFLNHQRTTIAKRKENERLEEKKKAKIRLEKTKQMGSQKMKDVLIIKNEGKAAAEQLYIRWENKYGEINPLVGKMPVKIDGGDSITFNMMIYAGTAPPYKVRVTWDDESQEGNVYETTIN